MTDVAHSSSITDKADSESKEPSIVIEDVKTLIDPDEVERGELCDHSKTIRFLFTNLLQYLVYGGSLRP